MFKRFDVHLMSNPHCFKTVDDLDPFDFQYYDKDGFELNIAEQKFYRAMSYPIDSGILNHHCWQEPWFELEKNVQDLILDHSMFLCRCSYEDKAKDQLLKLKGKIPQVDYLLRTKTKWGYDFALDAVNDDEIFEIVHIEYDNYDYEKFSNHMIRFDYTVRHTDWHDAARRIWQQKDKWKHLQGFEQNHWKAKYLLNWDRAEYTEKSLN